MKFPSLPWLDYAGALAITGVCTALALPFYPRFDSVNTIMLYLLGTTMGALRFGRGPSVALAVANILAFDFFFVPPRFSFDVADAQYLFTMAVMLVVALVIAHLMVNLSRHRWLADTRERRTAVLYAISRELAVASDAPAMAAAVVRHIRAVFHCTALVLSADSQGRLAPIMAAGEAAGDGQISLANALDLEFAGEVAARGERAAKEVLYQPMHGSRRVEGVIAVLPQTSAHPLLPEQLDLLEAFAVQLALALQRAHLVEAAETARTSEEHALLRNTLLASISHDLRTPLSAIAGAGSLIAQPDYALNIDRRMTLGRLIERKARDMSQQLSNILELMQMEQGSAAMRRDWHAVEDLVGHSLRVNEARLAHWRIIVDVSADLPLILVEATLVGQILCNLLENAAKYTPPGTTITISAAAHAGFLSLVIADDGPGLPPGDPERLFEKFQRGRAESNVVGVGLGLAICRAAARLHGGDIRALHNPGGGARFEINLPVEMQIDVLPPLDPEMLRARA